MQTASYKVSFTTGGLYYREAVKIVPIYMELQDWGKVRSQILSENLLQYRTKTASQRTLRELLPRLQVLTERELSLLSTSSRQEQNQLLWLAVCKQYRLVREFAVEVLREKYFNRDQEIKFSDFDAFFYSKAEWNEDLGKLTEMTRKKLRQVLFRTMKEAEIISAGGQILLAMFTGRVARVIIQDDASLYTVFPISEDDFRRQAVL